MSVGGVGTAGLGMLPMGNSINDPALAGGVEGADAKHRQEYAATHFEGVFMSMILKEMRATLSEGLFGKEASDTFGALFDLHMGQHLAERGGLGIREMVASSYRDRAVAQATAKGADDADVVDAEATLDSPSRSVTGVGE